MLRCNHIKFEINVVDKVPDNRTIVRLTTSYWSDRRGVNFKRSLTFLKKKSVGHNILQEECSCVGDTEAIQNIINLHSCVDGIYEVIMINVSRDIETGYIDDFDMKLIPYEEG